MGYQWKYSKIYVSVICTSQEPLPELLAKKIFQVSSFESFQKVSVIFSIDSNGRIKFIQKGIIDWLIEKDNIENRKN